MELLSKTPVPIVFILLGSLTEEILLKAKALLPRVVILSGRTIFPVNPGLLSEPKDQSA